MEKAYLKSIYNNLPRLFEVSLRKIEYSDLEIISNWRNDDTIRKFMGDTRIVNKKILTVWINKIMNSNNALAFLILDNKSNPSGVLEFKNINFCESSCEQGIFLSIDKVGTGIGTKVTLYQEYILHIINIDTIYLYIRNQNIHNLKFWQKLGAVSCGENRGLILLKSDKIIRRERLQRIAYTFNMGEIWDSIFP